MKATKSHSARRRPMSQTYSNRNEKKLQQIDEKERYQIEALLKARKKTKEIAELVGKSVRTIQREIKCEQVMQLMSSCEFVQTYKAYGALYKTTR